MSSNPSKSSAADQSGLDRLGLWPLRITWLLMPPIVGFGLATTFSHLGEGATLGIELYWWVGWFVGVVATLFPHPLSLTVIRILAPTSAWACLVAAGFHPGLGSASILLWGALAWSLLVTILAFGPVVGDRMVNGSAYGSERRMALRAPAYSLLAVVAAWLIIAGAIITPALLLAGSYYLLAGAALIVGATLVWFAGRMLYQLARRWLVFVPAGFVIHDGTSLVEPVLLRRTAIAALGPAHDVDEREVTDLSGGASGLALEVRTKEPTAFTLRQGRGEAKAIEATNIIFTPTLPGAVLSEARIRGIKIGPASVDADHT